MADLEANVPEQIQNLCGHFADVGGNFALSVQKHYIDVAKRIQLAPAVPAERDQRERSLRLPDRVRRCSKDVAQNHVHEFAAPRADLAAAATGLMFQAEPMLF